MRAFVEAAPSDTLRTLHDLLKREISRRTDEAAKTAAIEQGKREQGVIAFKKRIGAFVRTGDESLLEGLSETAIADARRMHDQQARKYVNDVEEIVDGAKRTGSRRQAYAELRRLTGIPDDVRAEAEARVDQIVSAAA
jgi:hypothetical protein